MLLSLRPTAAFTLLALAASASAQSVNVDIGLNTVFPIPSSSYGAGAAQPGTWNGVSAPATSPVALVGLSGSPAGVSLSSTGGSGNYAFDNLLTDLDDDSLMDDAEDVGPAGLGTSTWTFSSLDNGQYDVYTYAWAPDSSAYRTDVSVAGASGGVQTIGGAWPGGHALGVTYARHQVTVTGGSIVISVTTAANPDDGFGTLNGFQLKMAAPVNPFTQNCFGDGSGTSCPCNNNGNTGRGCQNSQFTGGALMAGTGNASLSNDTVQLNSSGEMPTALTLFVQGDQLLSPVNFGDGLRCAGGTLKRLYVKNASGGAVSAPGVGDLSVSARSAQLNHVIMPGQSKYYFAYYRDANAGFCAEPQGSTFNSTNGLTILWN